jgi:hypothetical protein
MIRSALGVIVGYITMFVVLFCLLTAAYLGMGADRAFQSGSFRPSILWDAVEIVVGLAAAAIGGFVCIAIARKRGAVMALVVVILLLGAVSAIPVWMASGKPEAIRVGGLSNMEAMMKARQPVWIALLNPVIGIVGALAGARLKRD